MKLVKEECVRASPAETFFPSMRCNAVGLKVPSVLAPSHCTRNVARIVPNP